MGPYRNDHFALDDSMTDQKPTITVSPRSDESQWDPNDVIAKRLAGEPFGVRADDIPLAEPGIWQLYIASSQGNEGRHYEMTHRKGWTPCRKDDLAPGISPESIGFKVAEDGQTLVRGTRGEEVVYKMPKDIYDQIQQQKADANTRSLNSESAARNDAAEATAATHGAQAGEYLAKHATISIKDRVTTG